MFEHNSKTIIGLERLMLEASGFDFRNRYPQRILLKLAKYHLLDQETVGKTAYNMSLDLYRTYAPLRQTAATLAISCVELSGRLCGQNARGLEEQTTYKRLWITRAEVMGEIADSLNITPELSLMYVSETLLDLLDLYTHHRTSTIVGPQYALEMFISIRITLNQEASAKHLPRYTGNGVKTHVNGEKATNGVKEKTPKKSNKAQVGLGDIATIEDKSTAMNGSSPPKPGLKDGTVRFMLDPQRAKEEKSIVSEFFTFEEEEFESEVPFERFTERERRRP